MEEELRSNRRDRLQRLACDRSLRLVLARVGCAATKIWRRMFDDELKLAKEGLAFMKEQVAKHCKSK